MTRTRHILRHAWLTSIRQPARTLLGIIGVAAVGALLFDMLLLSRGLVVSFRDLLERTGSDVRVFATDSPPFTGPPIGESSRTARLLASLPQIEAVVRERIGEAEIVSARDDGPTSPMDTDPGQSTRRRGGQRVNFIGSDPRERPAWTIIEGSDLSGADADMHPLVINRSLARTAGVALHSKLALRGRCAATAEALPPIEFEVVGIAEFPFDDASERTAAGRLRDAAQLCGADATDEADILLVRASPRAGPEGAAAAIRSVRPDLHVVTNADIVERFSRVEFSYFRQISAVLATVTLFFGFLLISVLLTVSVNQRLGEIATLRAIGLSRLRVVVGVLSESVILVGAGGLLAIPLGAGLSVWLERILHAMPGVSTGVQFFVFEPRALVVYLTLLAVAAVAAAAYPIRIVALLPIAATLRREVVS